MTPIIAPLEGTPEYRYTQAQLKARNCVERCIGVFKSMFTCIMGERKLRYEPQKVGHIINACAVLHNICISGRHNILNPVPDIPICNRRNVVNNIVNPGGIHARNDIINRYFN